MFALLLLMAALEALPEFLRPDPFGGVLKIDRTTRPAGFLGAVELEGARGGYVSCHLVVKLSQGGEYSLRVDAPSGGLQADLYREWFHLIPADKGYYPDALIPVRGAWRSRLPEPDNRIPGQTAQAFWLDVWIPAEAKPGWHEVTGVLEAEGKTLRLPVRVRVLPARVPAEDVVAIDHNSYGSGWLGDYFPGVRRRAGPGFFASDEFFGLIHAYHRIFHEHRGVYHQLGYGHAGKVGPEFAPALEGEGRRRRVADWGLYDRHYGPLLDGSAFAATRRGARPIPFVYLPINPEWPASFVNWGEPGYEAEFVNVVSQMERHFRERGWTRTRFELFFNHKKRYKGFPWDGDETRFENDLPYFAEYARLLRRAVPADSPVQFVFRNDVSWMMERQFKAQAGIINFWVCGGSIFSWYEQAPRLLKERGDIVWFYGGTPRMNEVSSAITLQPLKAWMWGVDGYVHWLAVSPGADPWFRSDGSVTALVYPGDRFGIDGPIPSVRLKLQRNAVADLALLDSLRQRLSVETLKREAARRYNGAEPKDWWTPRPPLADRPPWEWSNTDIDEVPQPSRRFFQNLDAAAWQSVREYVLELARRQP